MALKIYGKHTMHSRFYEETPEIEEGHCAIVIPNPGYYGMAQYKLPAPKAAETTQSSANTPIDTKEQNEDTCRGEIPRVVILCVRDTNCEELVGELMRYIALENTIRFYLDGKVCRKYIDHKPKRWTHYSTTADCVTRVQEAIERCEDMRAQYRWAIALNIRKEGLDVAEQFVECA
jgi:hypothetical protein